MDENTKKIAIGVIAVLAVGAAMFEGVNFVRGPQIGQSGPEVGHGTPGHGMKAAEMARQKAERGGSPSSSAGTQGAPPVDLAGDVKQ